MNYQRYISIDADVRFGRPCITGTRISVSDVLSWMSEGMSALDIVADFPELTVEKVYAVLAYAADRNRKTRIAS